MAAEAIANPLFLDTSLIVAATVEAHPAHHGEQVHDCNIVATMLAHGVRHLATRNAADFKRYESLISIDAITD